MFNEFKYGQTWKIWPSPLSLSLYSTFEVLKSVDIVCEINTQLELMYTAF